MFNREDGATVPLHLKLIAIRGDIQFSITQGLDCFRQSEVGVVVEDESFVAVGHEWFYYRNGQRGSSLFAPRQHVVKCHCAFADFSYRASISYLR